MYLPSSTPLPLFNFNFTGIQDNILLEDSGLNGIPLNFSRGLIVGGDTVFINLNNHHIPIINISLAFSTCTFKYIKSQFKNITLATGLYNEIVDPSY
jgi:hypothetical protein